jgi:hypothetical protein
MIRWGIAASCTERPTIWPGSRRPASPGHRQTTRFYKTSQFRRSLARLAELAPVVLMGGSARLNSRRIYRPAVFAGYRDGNGALYLVVCDDPMRRGTREGGRPAFRIGRFPWSLRAEATTAGSLTAAPVPAPLPIEHHRRPQWPLRTPDALLRPPASSLSTRIVEVRACDSGTRKRPHRQAFDLAGVEFIEENGGGPRLRLRKRPRAKPSK